MTKKSHVLYALVSRIRRAPNVSRLLDAFDAVFPDSIVTVRRTRRTEWQVWYGDVMAGFSGSFIEVRAKLAEDADDILSEVAERRLASQQKHQTCAAQTDVSPAVSAAMAEVQRLEAACVVLRGAKSQALSLLREFRNERLATVSGEMDGDAGLCWTNEERARVRYDEACDKLRRCQDDYLEALDYLSDEKREVRRTTLKARNAQGPAMVQQQAQQQQACAARVADLEQERDHLLDRIEGTEHLQGVIQRAVNRAAAGLGSTTATQDSVEALRLHAVDLRRELAAIPVPLVQQVAQQQQANAGARLTVVTNPTPPTHCSCCGRRLTDHVSVRHGIDPICRANGAAPTRDLFTTRSDYTVEDLLDVILVTDLDRGGRSVSNDTVGVIDDLRKAGLIRQGVPVVYRDSSGTWDQMRVKEGRFAGFSSVGVLTREDAIAWARAN